MIKFSAEGTDETGNPVQIVGLGVSEDNIQELREGRPIGVKARELGIDFPIEFLLFYGKTEEEMEKDLAAFINIKTKRRNGHEEKEAPTPGRT